MASRKTTLIVVFATLTLCAYVASFFFAVSPSLPGSTSKETGAYYFIFGFLFSITGVGLVYSFPWLANPVLWLGLVNLWLGNFRWAWRMGVISTILASSYMLFLTSDLKEGNPPAIGYWLWLASMAQLAWAGIW